MLGGGPHSELALAAPGGRPDRNRGRDARSHGSGVGVFPLPPPGGKGRAERGREPGRPAGGRRGRAPGSSRPLSVGPHRGGRRHGRLPGSAPRVMPLPGGRGGRVRGQRWRRRSGRWRLVRGPAGEREESRGGGRGADAAYLAASRWACGRAGGWPREVSIAAPGLPRPGGGLRNGAGRPAGGVRGSAPPAAPGPQRAARGRAAVGAGEAAGLSLLCRASFVCLCFPLPSSRRVWWFLSLFFFFFFQVR